jgi:hypothetical protein
LCIEPIRRAALIAVLTCAFGLSPLGAARARAQGTVNDVITFLVTNRAVVTDDFERDRAAAEAARDTIARALLVNLTSVPIATSSSGFVYRLNPQLGTVERATESFGGFFVERALTAGRGRASFGLSAARTAFDRLDGRELRDGTLVTVANRFRDEADAFDVETLTLRIRSSTMTLFGNVGLTERLEIGAAVPLVNLELEGQRVNVYRGNSVVQASGSASASGVADVALRAKFTVLAARNGGLAAAAEFRLPTGDEENLLGAGESSYRVLAAGSFEAGRFAVHGNGGFVRGGMSDEVTFAGAASLAAHPRVTVSGEVLVRRVNELRESVLVSAAHPTIDGVDTLRLTSGESAVTLSNVIAGLKWNVTGTLVVGGHVAWPVAHRGLTAPFTPTFALEYAF